MLLVVFRVPFLLFLCVTFFADIFQRDKLRRIPCFRAMNTRLVFGALQLRLTTGLVSFLGARLARILLFLEVGDGVLAFSTSDT
jgi:hypothetical protein